MVYYSVKINVVDRLMTRKPKVLDPNETYTFAKYFDLPYAIEDILADLDCTIDYQILTLPQKPSEIDLEFLSRQIHRNIRITKLSLD